MVDPFGPRLPFCMSRFGASVARCFANDAGSADILIQCQLLEICEVF
jgi:hypothetical protein